MLIKYIRKNAGDLKKNPTKWPPDLMLSIISFFIKDKDKKIICNQAKNRSDTILKKNGLNVPFDVNLDYNDIFFRTKAWYEPLSSEKGMIRISINPRFIYKYDNIDKNIDRTTYFILHEYAHSIYEVGYWDCKLNSEIIKLIQHANIFFPEEREETILESLNSNHEKEKFCDLFAYYLMKRIETENIDEIEKLCQKIIQKYNHLHIKEFNFNY